MHGKNCPKDESERTPAQKALTLLCEVSESEACKHERREGVQNCVFVSTSDSFEKYYTDQNYAREYIKKVITNAAEARHSGSV